MILGINACRARSGGGVAHLKGILKELEPSKFGIKRVHVWAYAELLSSLPDEDWLIKHQPRELDSSLLKQLLWERFKLPLEVNKFLCSLLLNVDAGSVCRFQPAIMMSRDMLSYEPGEIERFGISVSRLRLLVLRYVQNSSLTFADGTIFLTKYASRVIQQSCGELENIAYIPHGVGSEFQAISPSQSWPKGNDRPIRCLYVSNAALYKHQWNVVAAVEELRKQGFNLELELVGGGEGKAQEMLESQINVSDPNRDFVRQRDYLPQSELPNLLSQADLFVFASSCENMPNTLVEAMAAGLPIACSNRGPMPEVLEDSGVYFDPENPESIANSIADLITNSDKRITLANRTKELSAKYSWSRCAKETFQFVSQIAHKTDGPS